MVKIPKSNKKRLLIVFTVVIIISLATVFIISRQSTPKGSGNDAPINVLKGTTPDLVMKHDDIAALFYSGNYKEAMPRAKAYASDGSNSINLRLNMYDICIKSANKLDNKEESSTCFEEAKKLAATLDTVEGRQGWSKIVTNSHNNAPAADQDKNENSGLN